MPSKKDIEDKVQEYIQNFPHLRNPALIDLLRQAVKAWFQIQELEQLLEQSTDSGEKRKLINSIDRRTKTWISMLGNLGITYTRQQYKSKKKVVQPPVKRLKMLMPKKEEEESGETESD